MNGRNRLNFSGGPGALPESVLAQVQQAILAVPEVGLSILGISHRSTWFAAVVQELESNIRTLLGLGDDYHVIFLQGGATQQFSMIPMTWLCDKNAHADYVHTGYWSGKAIAAGRHEGNINVLWNGAESGFTHLPNANELNYSNDAAYLHYVSNETVEGLQFHQRLGREDVPRICDMSSDFLSQPCEANKFSLIYAHAQKNIGPAGVTVVIIKDSFLQTARPDLPAFLNYQNHIQTHSNFNTPPVFAIYVVLLVTRWLMNDIGGLQHMAEINHQKARLLYQTLDNNPDFYRGRAAPAYRSNMNVTFNLPTPEIEQKFLNSAACAGFSGLSGHRSVGGIRASIYNGLTLSAVEELVQFMDVFSKK